MFRGGDKLAALCVALPLSLCGCALQPPPPTVPEVPAAFQNGLSGAAAWPASHWYHGFGSAELDGLIARAATSNLDLVAGRARLIQADARSRQAGAALLPALDAGGSGNYLAGHSGQGSAHELDWSALLSTSYEVDFWGKNQATANAARFLDAAARADQDTLALMTQAAVADSYFEVLSLRERLQIAQSNLAAARSLLEAVQTRFNAGAADPLQLATQRTVLASAQLAIPDLSQRESEALTALALLVGQPPEQFQVAGSALDTLIEPQVAPGLPAQLLTRRPDIHLAEANLRAADADLVAAAPPCCRP